MDNKNIIVLVIVIALIALFVFQTYSRMKKRVDSEAVRGNTEEGKTWGCGKGNQRAKRAVWAGRKA